MALHKALRALDEKIETLNPLENHVTVSVCSKQIEARGN